MVPASDLDARLLRHHEELVQLFTGHRLAATTRRRRIPRHLILALALAAAAAIATPVLTLRLAPSTSAERQVHIAGFTITAAASNEVMSRMTGAQAIAVAETFNASHPVNLPHGGPPITSLTVTGAWFVPNAEHVVGRCVNFYLPRPANIWVVPLTAPAQSGWNGVRGAFLVDDATGTTGGAQMLMSPARFGPPVC